jgi:ABC-2 type transport system permease protein
VFASYRAELLVLRKWRVAWALVAITPLIILVQYYALGFFLYQRPISQGGSPFGTPDELLVPLLPSQSVTAALNQFWYALPFTLLGAVVAGSDWGRGTIKTSLVQTPSRSGSFAAHVLAVMTAAAVSVLAAFGVAWGASEAVSTYVGRAALEATIAPGTSLVFEAIGGALLISFCYVALGIALGTLFRSTAGAIAAALAWYFVVDSFLYDLSLNLGGWAQQVYNAFPQSSVVTIGSIAGGTGGGVDNSMYEPVAPWLAVAILGSYTVVFVGAAWLLLRRADIVKPERARPSRGVNQRQPESAGGTPLLPRRPGVLASARAELMVMARSRWAWAFVLATPISVVLEAYFAQYLLYLQAGSGAIIQATPSQVLSTVLPGQFLPAVLSTFGPLGQGVFPGLVAFFCIGAFVGGSSWSGGTMKTALLLGTGRVRTLLGQLVAVGTAVVAAVLLSFVVGGMASVALSVATTGHVSPAQGPFPGPGQLVGAIAAGLLVGLAWSAAGWALATVSKSATGALAAIFVWSTVAQANLDQLMSQVHGPVRALFDFLPDAATDTLIQLYGKVNNGYTGSFAELALPLSLGILGAYLVVAPLLPIGLARRRDVA